MNKPSYILVEADDPEGLQASVNKAIAEGYEPAGGVSASGDPLRGQRKLVQAMTLPQSDGAAAKPARKGGPKPAAAQPEFLPGSVLPTHKDLTR